MKRLIFPVGVILAVAFLAMAAPTVLPPIMHNYFTTNAAPVQGSATSGIPISGGVGSNNVFYGGTISGGTVDSKTTVQSNAFKGSLSGHLVGGVYDDNGKLMLDPTNRVLQSAAGLEIIGWEDLLANDAIGHVSVDWGSRQLQDGSGNVVLDWSSINLAGNAGGLSNLNASSLASGTVPTARLGSGTANGTTFLAGDQTWKTVTSGSGGGPATNALMAVGSTPATNAWSIGPGVTTYTDAFGIFIISNGVAYSTYSMTLSSLGVTDFWPTNVHGPLTANSNQVAVLGSNTNMMWTNALYLQNLNVFGQVTAGTLYSSGQVMALGTIGGLVLIGTNGVVSGGGFVAQGGSYIGDIGTTTNAGSAVMGYTGQTVAQAISAAGSGYFVSQYGSVSNLQGIIPIYTNADLLTPTNELTFDTDVQIRGAGSPATNKLSQRWYAEFDGTNFAGRSYYYSNASGFWMGAFWSNGPISKAVLYLKAGLTNEDATYHVQASKVWTTNGVLTAVGGGGSCTTVLADNSGASVVGSFVTGSLRYIGQWQFDPGANVSICGLTYTMGTTVLGVNYRASIWTLSGNNLDVQQGSFSNNQAGTGSGATLTWTFSSPIPVSNGTQYALVISKSDGTDFATDFSVSYSADGNISGIVGLWDGSGVIQNFTANDAILKVTTP